MIETNETDRLSAGIEGLDEILHGGLIPERGYMLRGEPGAGKTLLALHFLVARTDGETALFVNLEEEEEDIRRNAAAVGIDHEGIQFLDLSPTSAVFVEDRTYSIFEPRDVEGSAVTQEIADRVRNIGPDRVVVDPVTQLRYLTADEYQFRKQITGFMRFLEEQAATVVFTSQATASAPDDDMQFISHGVIDVQHSENGRTVRVPKFRGSAVEGGRHAMRITDDGVRIHPRLTPNVHGRPYEPGVISSGVPKIDAMLHGGIERGSVTILTGPTGVGKTSLGAQFMKEAAGRDERSVIYLFEESRRTFLERSAAINIPVDEMQTRGTLQVEEIEPLTRSADEFAHMVRTEVETRDAGIVMIDGTAGFRLALRGDAGGLVRQLHSLCRYLKNMGVTVILVEETESIIGELRATNWNISYLADNIVFLRYLELQGELRKTIGVLKKRMSDFERQLREFRITADGITVGESFDDMRGVLRGTPDIDRPAEPSGTDR